MLTTGRTIGGQLFWIVFAFIIMVLRTCVFVSFMLLVLLVCLELVFILDRPGACFGPTQESLSHVVDAMSTTHRRDAATPPRRVIHPLVLAFVGRPRVSED